MARTFGDVRFVGIFLRRYILEILSYREVLRIRQLHGGIHARVRAFGFNADTYRHFGEISEIGALKYGETRNKGAFLRLWSKSCA